MGTVIDIHGLSHLTCDTCGKAVSSGFAPVATEMGSMLVIRAHIECPECIEIRSKEPGQMVNNKH